ncbi:MAG TPA: hypothetical protein DDW20_00180 [Firmicutes bacterium]|nr:hypothetical protein [Bacillota bacterium]
MFQNPSTIWIEILVLVLIVGFFGTMIGIYVYKKIHHIPTGECSTCAGKKNALLKAYYKKYKK